MTKPTKKEIRSAAAILGAMGGAAGKGKAKRNKGTLTSKTAKALAALRSPKAMRRNVDYAALAKKAHAARRAKAEAG